MSDDFFDIQTPTDDVDIPTNIAVEGDDIILNNLDPTLKKITVGLGWDFASFSTDSLDLDASLFLIGQDGKTREDEDFIFYNNREACDGAIRHNGDNRTGAGDGDDETISIDLEALPFDITRILFVVSIYKAKEKDQNLAMVKNTFFRIVNAENNYEMSRCILDVALKERKESAMIVASIDREGPKWHFRPMATFVDEGLGKIAEDLGIIVGAQ